MTLSTTLSVKQYDGDGATTSFPTVFKFVANEDVRVTLRSADGIETVWAENTHYALAGAGGDAGGTVTVLTSPADHTPAVGETLVIERSTLPTQETDYPEGGAFPAVAHENALDKLTMLVQELRERVDRALRYPVSDPAGLSAEIPNTAKRASRYLAFDADGATIAADPPEGGNVVSAFIGTLLDDADAAAARSTLGLGTAAIRDAGTAAENVVVLDGTARLPAVSGELLTALPGSLLRGFKSGLVPSNNATDADHDLDFTAGVAWALDGAAVVEVAALTKKLDAAFAEGANAGALGDGVSLPTSGTIHLFAIRKDADGSGDIYGDTTLAGTNVPAGWTVVRRIFSITTDASANLTAFSAMERDGGGLRVDYQTHETSHNGIGATTETDLAIGVPAGIEVEAFGHASMDADGSRQLYIYKPGLTTERPVFAGSGDSTGSTITTGMWTARTNTTAEITYRLQTTAVTITIALHGWIDALRS